MPWEGAWRNRDAGNDSMGDSWDRRGGFGYVLWGGPPDIFRWPGRNCRARQPGPDAGCDHRARFEVATPAVGFRTGVPPYNLMASVTAPDDRTVIVSWKSIYPGAGVLMLGGGSTRFGLVPFPRHILEPTFRDASADVIQQSPYWG